MAILYSNDVRLIKAVSDASHCQGGVRCQLPLRAGGTVVLPEGAVWLSERATDGRIEYMAGSDLAKGDKLP